MSSVDGLNPPHRPPAIDRAPPVRAVPPPPACRAGGLHEHRLGQPAAVLDLLGVVPGSVPYSTHLAIGRAVARAQSRAIEAALAGLGAHGPDYGRLAAREAGRVPRVPEPIGERPEPAAAEPAPTEYALPRRRWPVGGLVDLVV